MRPKISILSAVFNESQHIKEMMMSVKFQEFTDYEHVIVDDQSDDETFAIASSLADQQTRVFKNPQKGKVAAFNYAFRKSKGEWIVLLAGDDTLPEDSLRKRAEVIKQIDGLQNNICVKGHLKSFSNEKKFNGLTLPKHAQGNFTGGVVLLSRRLSEDVFNAPVSLPNEDTWLELCAKYFSSANLLSPGVVLNYRIHERNSSGGRKSYEEASKNFGLRAAAFGLFEEKYSCRLTQAQRAELRNRVELEKFRRLGQIWKILFQSRVEVLTKVSNITHANRFMFSLRQVLFRYVSGWR